MKALTTKPPKPPIIETHQQRKGGQYKCTVCGERFLSLMELRAHRKKYKGQHRRPKLEDGTAKDIVAVIEDKIEEVRDRGYHGYREVDRSS